MAKTTTAAETTTAAKFTKAQLVGAKRFANRRDLLRAVLADDTLYTVAEATAALEKYMKGKVT